MQAGAKAAVYWLHGDCEVAGLAEEGFPNSWWAATVEAINRNHTVKVKYRDMLEDDDDPTKLLVEIVPKERVRPVPPDDSHTVPISSRQCGEAVECWTKDGWWTGHVHEVYDDRITVFFPATPEEEPVVVREAPPGGYKHDDNRVRTSKKWLRGASSWNPEPLRVYGGCGNHRTQQAAQRAVEPHAADPAARTTAAQPRHPRPPSVQDGERAGEKRKQSVQLLDDELMPAPKCRVPAPAWDTADGQVKAKPAFPKQPSTAQPQRPALKPAAQRAGSDSRQQEASRKPAAALRSGTPSSSQRPVTAVPKQPMAAAAPAAGSRPPPLPAPSPRPSGSSSHAKPAAATADPLWRNGSEAAASQSRPAAPQPPGSRLRPGSAHLQHSQRQEQQRAMDPWALPPQQEDDQPREDLQHSKGQRAQGKGASTAAGALPQQQRQQKPASASHRPPHGGAAGSRPASAAAKHPGHPAGRSDAATIRPGSKAAVKQAAAALRRQRRDAEEHHERTADAAHKRNAPPWAPRDGYIIPKIVVQDRGPADLDISGGPFVCLDNIGAFTDREALREILHAKFADLREMRFADIQLDATVADAGLVHGGWACLDFCSARDAALAYPQLQRLYLVGASVGPPRPLLAHWPRWQDTPWGDGTKPEMLGHLRLPHPASAHFVQPNSIEFEMALRWRLITERLGYAKREIQAQQQAKLTALLASYRKAKRVPEPGAEADTLVGPGGSKADARSDTQKLDKSYIWLKGIAADTDESMVRTAFEQFTDEPQVKAPKSAVSEKPFGHLLVTLKEPKKAEYVMNDLRENIFVMHGTPRPVHASVARPGAPLGSQRLYDAALEAVLGVGAARDSADPSESAAADDTVREGKIRSSKASSQLALVEIVEPATGKQPATVDEAAALKLRKLLARCEVERAELWWQGLDLKRELHKEQLHLYAVEKEKFNTIQKLNEAPVVTQLNGGQKNSYCNLRMA